MSISVRAALVQATTVIDIDVNHVSRDDRTLDPKSGKYRPAEFIRQLRVFAEGVSIVESDLSAGVSGNPSFQFKALGLKRGAKVEVEWLDTADRRGRAQTTVA